MRDDQVVNLIKKEISHIDNLSLLRYQQNKIRMDSIIVAICSPWNIIKCLWSPFYFMSKVERIYQVKAQEFNERMKEALSKEKLRI